MTVVEFPSYESAMTNNQDPATHEFAEGMVALCDDPPVFHNLDVIDPDLEQRRTVERQSDGGRPESVRVTVRRLVPTVG